MLRAPAVLLVLAFVALVPPLAAPHEPRALDEWGFVPFDWPAAASWFALEPGDVAATGAVQDGACVMPPFAVALGGGAGGIAFEQTSSCELVVAAKWSGDAPDGHTANAQIPWDRIASGAS